MRGTLILDKDITSKIDTYIAEYIHEHVMRKSVIITAISKVHEIHGNKDTKVYQVDFHDVITEMARGGKKQEGESIF